MCISRSPRKYFRLIGRPLAFVLNACVGLLGNECRKVILLGLLVLSNSSWAADVASDLLGRDLQIDVPAIREFPQRPASPEIIGSEGEQLSLLCVGVIFEGDDQLIPSDVANEVRKLMLGQNLALIDIVQGAEFLESLLRSEGFLFATASIPPQDITDGVIAIEVFIPKFDENPFTVRRTSDPDRSARTSADALSEIETLVSKYIQAGRAIRRQSVEQALLLLNELPGMSATSEFIEGDAEGTSRLVIDIEPETSREFLVSRNNHGSATTGKHINEYSGSWSNYFSKNERITARIDSGGGTTLRSLQISYPVITDGYFIDSSVSRLNYNGGSAALGNAIEGGAKTGSIGLRIPLVRSLESSQTLTTSLNGQWSEDFANSVLKSRFRSAALNFGWQWISFDRLFRGGATQASITATHGEIYLNDDGFDGLTVDQTPGAGLFTDGEFNKLSLQVVRNQRLLPGFRAVFEASGQYSFENLHSSQRRSVGGINGVRAYPIGEGSSDSNLLTRTELVFEGNVSEFPSQRYELALFHDRASVWVHEEPKVAGRTMIGANHYDLLGWGVRGALETGQGGRLTFMWAKKLGKGRNPNPATDSQGNDNDGFAHNQRFFFTLEQAF